MPRTNALAAAAADQNDGCLIPMFVCAGCRPEPLGYTSLEHGDHLDEMVACPMREVCTWHAGHDLGGDFHYNEQPDGALLPVLFSNEPYFACPHFNDFASFVGARKVRVPVEPREAAEAAGVPTAPAVAAALRLSCGSTPATSA